jgi:hypothetical protein
VPQQQRLQQCALACKAWASAATLATVHVELKLQAEAKGQAIPVLEIWLQQHAGQVESLQLTLTSTSMGDMVYDPQLSYSDRTAQHELQLPWAKLSKLQRLQLEGFKLTLPGEEDSQGATSGAGAGAGAATSSSSSSRGNSSGGKGIHTPAPLLLPSLQYLELSKVQLVSSSSLLQLARAPGLTSLKISDISFLRLQYCSQVGQDFYNKEPAIQQLAAAIAVLLQQLPRLAVLELPRMPMSAAAMQRLGAMQGLQEVRLGRVVHMPMCELQHLPSSITQLLFDSESKGGRHSDEPSLLPELQQLTGLLRLELCDCAVPPTVLGAFTRLQGLRLFCCTLQPAPVAAVPAQVIVDDDIVYETEGTAALLDALSKMTCLQDLDLTLEGLDTVSTAPQRFAALTASTQLVRLAVSPLNCVPLATGAAQHMFPAGRQLPLLQELTIASSVGYTGWDRWCLDDADIHSIAACCTGLRELNLGHNMPPGAEVHKDIFSCTACTTSLGAKGLLKTVNPSRKGGTLLINTLGRTEGWTHLKHLLGC